MRQNTAAERSSDLTGSNKLPTNAVLFAGVTQLLLCTESERVKQTSLGAISWEVTIFLGWGTGLLLPE